MIPPIDFRYYAMKLLLWALTPVAVLGSVFGRVGIAFDQVRSVGLDPITDRRDEAGR